MAVPLGSAPLWGGVVVLAAFNLYAARRARGGLPVTAREVFAHMLVDVIVLAW